MLSCGDAPGWQTRQCLSRQAPLLIEDSETTIETFVDVDRGFRIAPTAGTGKQLEAMRAAGDGVVVTNDALVLEAKDGVRIEGGGPRPIRRHRIGGRVSKACIETREEICEVRVRAVTVPHAGEAELTAEPILEGAKEPLDATLGLRAVRGDPVDAQFLQGAFDLCGRGFSGQLLLEGQRACGGPVEDAMAIAVGGDGDAFGLGEGVKDVEIAVRIFLVAKGGGEHF